MKPSRTFLAYAAMLALCAAAEAQTPAPPPTENAKSAEAAHWHEVYATDLAFIRDTLSANYIYARYPGGAEWKAKLDPALAQANAAKVDSESAYRAALSQFASSFRDAHLGVRFDGQSAPAAAPTRRKIDLPAGISDAGPDIAWVRIPVMSPSNETEAAALHAIIDAAPTLRDRKAIVFDVRGNPGGTYNWFVAVLKSLYGEPVGAYYARERLKIVPVILQPTQLAAPKPQSGPAPAPPADRFNTPADPDLDRVLSKPRFEKLPDGKQLMFVGAQNERDRERPDGPPSANPVKAKVYVLTDGGCGSACLSFIDELLQFPNTTQIGLETGVDMRSGTPVSYRLPSGKGEVHAPNMVRDKRTRGDNVPWTPKIKYDGADIADTAAVKAWVQDIVTRDKIVK